MQTSTLQVPTSDISVAVIWYCRGCKCGVEVQTKPEVYVVNCPKCGMEKNRVKFDEAKR